VITAPIIRPVRIVSESPSRLTLDLWRPAGMELLDHIAGVLDHYQEHRDDVFPPCWSLQHVDATIERECGSPVPATIRAHIRALQNAYAREYGYANYKNLQRAAATQLALAADNEQLLIEETVTATTILRQQGVPPRQARKGRPAGRIIVKKRSTEWLRLNLTRPRTIDLAAVTSTLRRYLRRRPLNVRETDRDAHLRIFRVQDLTCRGDTVQEIADRLELEDAEARGQERVAELKKAYNDLVRRFGFPPIMPNQ
jgi:hypothetical protein